MYRVPVDRCMVMSIDMWDKHWCREFTARAAALAPRVDAFLHRMRTWGAHILHAPANVAEAHADTPAYKHAVAAAASIAPIEIPEIRKPILRVPPAPCSGSPHLGCKCGCPKDAKPWSRQHPRIHIDDTDYLSQDYHVIYSLLKLHDVQLVLVAGIALNRCVVNRYFGLCNLIRLGFNAVLVEDQTTPTVFFDGPTHAQHHTDWVEHIRAHIAPTTSSESIGCFDRTLIVPTTGGTDPEYMKDIFTRRNNA